MNTILQIDVQKYQLLNYVVLCIMLLTIFSLIVWTQWGAWSECSESCDGGIRDRIRVCEGSVGECAGEAEEIDICNKEPCKGIYILFLQLPKPMTSDDIVVVINPLVTSCSHWQVNTYDW